MMLYRAFDWLMTKLGHKYAFVDIYGNIVGYRYYPFFVERNRPVTWKERYLPNLFIHQTLKIDSDQQEESLVGEVAHTHPWSTLSVVIKGGYVEELNYKETKTLNAPAMLYRNWDTSHRILSAKPNTWSLFFHGIRRGMWAFDLQVHETPCVWCQKNNGNVCFNADKGRFMEFPKHREIKDTSLESKGWRETSWIKCDKDFEQLIQDRRESIARALARNRGKKVEKGGFSVVKNAVEAN